ncbi:hypothetical protein VV02_22850 [Luteipulveratus mongoliensis]|uniref:Uncharacterized protein n=1 Tax=Luteipulveratus mongoliensis TaxID=571913 RepID=A0A0K1JR77_9MICO|nr:hypothetical protein VV02_22850 [Luteipulveratus mongoliensis]
MDLTGRLVAEDGADQTEYRVTTRVTQAGIEAQSGHRLLLHAAGAADPQTGRTMVLVAESGTGKTTAAARLCRTLGYVTDETVALSEDLVALPYAKPLSVVIDASDPYDKSQHGPDELGLVPCPTQPEVALLVLLERVPDRNEPPHLEPVRLLDALVALIPQTSALPRLTRPLQRLAALAEATGGVRRLHYRDIEDATQLLVDTLQTSEPMAVDRTAHPPTASQALDETYAEAQPTDVRIDPTALLTRGAYTDAVEADGEVLVLIGASPIRLSGLGATIWLATAEPVGIEDLIRRCVSDHGSHPDARRLIEDAIGELAAYGLLVSAAPGVG